MSQTMTRHDSPREHTGRQQRTRLAAANRPLNERDQAILNRILEGKCDFVPNPLFAQSDAQRRILDDVAPLKRPDSSWYCPVMENLGASSAKPATAGALTNTQEQAIFTQLNYCRYKVAESRQQIGTGPASPELAAQILAWFAKAEAYRDQIVQYNLALVLAMAKRVWTTVEFSELVSEGNMALLRAVDKFDVLRGFKFSTYACRAILKAFSRSGIKLRKDRQFFSREFNPKLDRTDFMDTKRADHEKDCAEEVCEILYANKAALTEVERKVL